MALPPLHRLATPVDGMLDELPLELLREVEDRIEHGVVGQTNCGKLSVILKTYKGKIGSMHDKAQITARLELDGHVSDDTSGRADHSIISLSQRDGLSAVLLGLLADAGAVQERPVLRKNNTSGLHEVQMEARALSSVRSDEDFIERHAMGWRLGARNAISSTYDGILLPLMIGGSFVLYESGRPDLPRRSASAVTKLLEALLRAFREKRDLFTLWVPTNVPTTSYSSELDLEGSFEFQTSAEVRVCSAERAQRRGLSNGADDTPGYLERKVHRALLTRQGGAGPPAPPGPVAPWPAPGQPGGRTLVSPPRQSRQTSGTS